MIKAAFLIGLTALALGGCGSKVDDAELNQIDAKLGGKGDVDPALTAALEDQIMVDPKLAGQANENAIKPPPASNQALVPATPDTTDPQTLGAIAAQQAALSKDSFNGCSLDVAYSIEWANRLPAEFPLYPKAIVSEAAGSDNDGCNLRAVTYATAVTPTAMVAFYRELAKRGGFAVQAASEGGETLVSGKRTSDGAAFYAVVQPNGAGSTTDLVANRGR